MAMEFTRRQFFGGLSVLFATASARTYAQAVGAGKPLLSFGVLSDVHISKARSTELWEKALRYFDGQGADGVVVAGDIADQGLVSQLTQVADVWFKVFPDGRSTRDGRKVEQLFALGNHDFEGWKYGRAKTIYADLPKEERLVTDMAGNWERLFHEPYRPIWQKDVKGYTFIGAHWVSWEGIPEIGPYMKKHGPALAGKRPFFYIQHPQPKDTCLGWWIWGHDNGCSTEALKPYPNAVAFSGHSHKTLTCERNVWQGAFTSVGTASLYNLGSEIGRENGSKSPIKTHGVMKPYRSWTGKETVAAHGQFVRVYADFIEIERRDFVSGRSVGPNWVVTVPAGQKAPFLYASRKAASKAPGPFPAGAEAQVKVSRPKGVVRLEFPPARAIAGASPIFDYEIEAVHAEADVERTLFTKYVYGPGVFADLTEEKGPIVAEFDERLFPSLGEVTFRIRAHELFGKFNEPIVARLG